MGQDKIQVDPEPQALTHRELRSHAQAAHGRCAGDTAPMGLRADHATWVNGLLNQTRDHLTKLAATNTVGVEAATAFGDTEEANSERIAAVEVPESPLT